MLAAFGLCLALAASAVLIGAPGSVEPVAAAQSAPSGNVHLGVATCGGTTCHGRNEADGEVVRQDELMLWQEESSPAGAHSRAFRVLANARSQEIGRKLGIGDPQSAKMCLGCHSTPAAQRGPRFRVDDGVGCEACHGPAGDWLKNHYATDVTHARNVSQGLVPLERASARADVCLDCHFGGTGEGQFVTHRIMAAGHPRISFELDLFSALQQHYNIDGDYVERKGRPDAVKMWAVGQTRALDRSLGLFTTPRLGQEGIFPEFYFYDCHSCHRRISDDPDPKLTVERNPGRDIPLGMPPYNDENMIMLSAAAKIAAPGLSKEFEDRSAAFHKAMRSDRNGAITAAQALRQTSAKLGDSFARTSFTRAQVFSMMDMIASEAISERFTDYEGAVQSVMAIDTLLNGLVNQGSVTDRAAGSLRIQINQAYAAVAEPNAFDSRKFRRALGEAVRTIRTLK